MRNRLGDEAYTIVEVFIVMAVTGLLLVAALLMIGPQQQRTGFQQSIHDLQAEVNAVINNVSTGYYSNPGDFSCGHDNQGPILTLGTNSQGQNTGCIFIGRAMQFSVKGTYDSGRGGEYDVYNLVGLQYAGDLPSNNISTDLSEALPVADAKSSDPNPRYNNVPNDQEVNILAYGLQAKTMQYVDASNGATHKTWGVAFISTLGQVVDGNVTTGPQLINLYGVRGTTGFISTSIPSGDMAAALDNYKDYKQASSVSMCFQGGINQKGTITIGGSNRQLITTLSIGTGSCP